MTDAKPPVLVHPPLPMFQPMMSAYEPLNWPTDRKDITAIVGVGSNGVEKDILDALPNLKSIVCFGVGIEGFDLSDLAARNITLTNCAGFNHDDVADFAMGLVIAVARRFSHAPAIIASGAWSVPVQVPPQKRLRGKRMGIVGLGAIGAAVATRAEAFGLEIAWYGPRAKPEARWRYEPDLKALARWADFLVVCAPGGPETHHLVDAEVIAALGADGVLVNIARGSLVDEDALIEALKAERLGGAGLDVYEEEPTPPAKWADVPNIYLTPHLAGTTRESLVDAVTNVLENLRRHFADEPLLTPVRAKK